MSLPFINRELSWLEFNQRVLNEALRSDLPLLERVKFLAITASNLDEFFQVRVGSLILLRRSGRKNPDPSGMTPVQQLAAIRKRVQRMIDDQYLLFNTVLRGALQEAGIRLLECKQLGGSQANQVATAFHDQISPLLTPLAVVAGEEPPVVPVLQLIVACRVADI